jgi:acyl carrier protein
MPDRNEAAGRLNEIFREMFDDDEIQINDDTTAGDIDGWDSIAHIMLVLAVEREFQIKLTAAEVGELKNVGQMIDLIILRTPSSAIDHVQP